MTAISRGNALKLASLAHDQGAEVLRGTLAQSPAGRWSVGSIDVESWLSKHAGREIVLAAAAVHDEGSAAAKRTCRTCGNPYEGPVCPQCDAVRRRLRGG